MGYIIMLTLAVLFTITSSFPQQVSIGKGGVVSASFGGYSASAGLGGATGDGGAKGGLFARAGLPDGTGAGAGLGGQTAGGAAGGAYAGAGVAGGPKASAGLGGVAGSAGAEGGLHSEAGVSKGSSSGAGVGGFKTTGIGGGGGFFVSKAVGSGAASGAGGSVQKSGTFFDDVFNIPTSVLKAVNQLVNNNAQNKRVAGRGGLRKRGHVNFNFAANGGAAGGAAAGGAVKDCANTPEGCVITKTKSTNVANAGAKLDANFQLDTRAGCDKPEGCVVVKEKRVFDDDDAGSSDASSSSSGSTSGTVRVNKNYDAIFNIPISVLNSVNQLLNNLG